MSYAKELNQIPISNLIKEIHFGKTSKISMWIEFETPLYEIWRGSFECGEIGIRKIISQENNEYLIFANGKGYRINNTKKELISEIKFENIFFAHKLNEKECLIAYWEGLYLINNKDETYQIADLFDLGEISIKNENKTNIIGSFSSSIYQWKKRYFKFDKEKIKFEIKKHPQNIKE